MHTFKKKVSDLPAFYSAYVDVINGILRLTPKEREVFSLMLGTSKEFGTNGIITQGIRDLIMNQLEMSAPNLSKIAKAFKRKSIIVKTVNGDWQISKSLIPTLENKVCTVTYNVIIAD